MAFLGKVVEAFFVKPPLAIYNGINEVTQGKNVGEALGQAAIDLCPVASLTQFAINSFRGCRVLIQDASDGRGFLGVTWDAAGLYNIVACRFNEVIRATSWEQVAQDLRRIADKHDGIYEVQFWGHGSPGTAYIGNDRLTAGTLHTPAWQAIRSIFKDDGVWWFRTCSTFNTDDGRHFAKAFSDHFNVRVAGHTVLIHAIHPGLVVLRPGNTPAWSDESGSHCLCTDMYHHEVANKL